MRTKLQLNGYLTKYLKVFDDDWMRRRGFKFSILCRSQYREVYLLLRHWEHDKQNADEMLEQIENWAHDLKDLQKDPHWKDIVACNILLFVHIHALAELRPETAIDEIRKIGKNTKCLQIIRILSRMRIQKS